MCCPQYHTEILERMLSINKNKYALAQHENMEASHDFQEKVLPACEIGEQGLGETSIVSTLAE